MKIIDWHKERIEWFKKKTGCSTYGVYWISFIKGIVIGAVIILLTGCGTVAQVWETGTEVVSNTVDTVVTGASDLVTAVGTDIVDTGAFVVDTGAGVVEGVSERIDEETDKIEGDGGN